MRFHIGQIVEKFTGDYTGPGMVRGVVFLDDGIIRYVVSHKIEGGTGALLHLYSEANLREILTFTRDLGVPNDTAP